MRETYLFVARGADNTRVREAVLAADPSAKLDVFGPEPEIPYPGFPTMVVYRGAFTGDELAARLRGSLPWLVRSEDELEELTDAEIEALGASLGATS